MTAEQVSTGDFVSPGVGSGSSLHAVSPGAMLSTALFLPLPLTPPITQTRPATNSAVQASRG